MTSTVSVGLVVYFVVFAFIGMFVIGAFVGLVILFVTIAVLVGQDLFVMCMSCLVRMPRFSCLLNKLVCLVNCCGLVWHRCVIFRVCPTCPSSLICCTGLYRRICLLCRVYLHSISSII